MCTTPYIVTINTLIEQTIVLILSLDNHIVLLQIKLIVTKIYEVLLSSNFAFLHVKSLNLLHS